MLIFKDAISIQIINGYKQLEIEKSAINPLLPEHHIRAQRFFGVGRNTINYIIQKS